MARFARPGVRRVPFCRVIKVVLDSTLLTGGDTLQAFEKERKFILMSFKDETLCASTAYSQTRETEVTRVHSTEG